VLGREEKWKAEIKIRKLMRVFGWKRIGFHVLIYLFLFSHLPSKGLRKKTLPP
jgi:hypothetical protein